MKKYTLLQVQKGPLRVQAEFKKKHALIRKMGAVKSRSTASEPPPLPTRFTWEEYARLRELSGPVYEIATGLFVYEATVYVRKPTEEDEGEVKEEETSEIRFFSENPLSEGVVYLSLCGYKLVFEHFHNRGVEVYEKLRAGLFVPTGATKRRRVFFNRPRVYDRPATEPRVCHERSTDEEYLQFIFE